jgi:hypothetical protein
VVGRGSARAGATRPLWSTRVNHQTHRCNPLTGGQGMGIVSAYRFTMKGCSAFAKNRKLINPLHRLSRVIAFVPGVLSLGRIKPRTAARTEPRPTTLSIVPGSHSKRSEAFTARPYADTPTRFPSRGSDGASPYHPLIRSPGQSSSLSLWLPACRSVHRRRRAANVSASRLSIKNPLAFN